MIKALPILAIILFFGWYGLKVYFYTFLWAAKILAGGGVFLFILWLWLRSKR